MNPLRTGGLGAGDLATGGKLGRPLRWSARILLGATVALVAVALAQGPFGGATGMGGYEQGPAAMQGEPASRMGPARGCGPVPGFDGRNDWSGHGSMGGYGMMGGPGGMDGYRGGRTMAGAMGAAAGMQVLPSSARPLDDAAVKRALQRAADAITPGAELHDIMVFTNNVYAQVLDAQGEGVAEILLDRYSGAVSPEPGPDMMWNTRWGMAAHSGGGAVGGLGCMARSGAGPWSGRSGDGTASSAAGPAAVDEAAARDRANTFLAGYLPGARVLGGQAFPGYYTFDFGSAGTPKGMLSVNTSTGRVWPHGWHGTFIREME